MDKIPRHGMKTPSKKGRKVTVITGHHGGRVGPGTKRVKRAFRK